MIQQISCCDVPFYFSCGLSSSRSRVVGHTKDAAVGKADRHHELELLQVQRHEMALLQVAFSRCHHHRRRD